jgi:hypothetical protein
VSQLQDDRLDMPRGLSASHLVLMSTDLLTLDEWVIESINGLSRFSLHRAASDDPADGSDRIMWRLTARGRGKADSEAITLAFSRGSGMSSKRCSRRQTSHRTKRGPGGTLGGRVALKSRSAPRSCCLPDPQGACTQDRGYRGLGRTWSPARTSERL